MEAIQLVQRQGVQQPLQERDPEEVSPAVEQHATPAEARRVCDLHVKRSREYSETWWP